MSPCQDNAAASFGYANAAGAYCERSCVLVLLAGHFRFVEPDAQVGVEPLADEDRIPFEHYLISLGQPFGVVEAMDLAGRAHGFNRISNLAARKSAGLTSDSILHVSDLISDTHCKTYGKLSANCVDFKEKEPQTAAAP